MHIPTIYKININKGLLSTENSTQYSIIMYMEEINLNKHG